MQPQMEPAYPVSSNTLSTVQKSVLVEAKDAENLTRIARRLSNGCLVRRTKLYSQVRLQCGVIVKAHRLAYFLAYGEIPEGKQIDHRCRHEPCIEPTHLEAVSNRENGLRGIGPAARNVKKTKCKRGHPLSGENIYQYKCGNGVYRQCRTCARMRKKQFWEKNKAVMIWDRQKKRYFRLAAVQRELAQEEPKP